MKGEVTLDQRSDFMSKPPLTESRFIRPLKYLSSLVLLNPIELETNALRSRFIFFLGVSDVLGSKKWLSGSQCRNRTCVATSGLS